MRRRRGAVAALLGLASLWAAVLVLSPLPAAAEEYNGPTPDSGPVGTQVTISGNLIGCYASGPGEESSTWGLPQRVVYRWNDAVMNNDETQAFSRTVGAVKAPTIDEPGLREIASHTFGDAGWKLTFGVPDGPAGNHIGVLSFEPQCNYKSVDHPDGFTHNAENIPLGFCITDKSGTCPETASVPAQGRDVGGGFTQVGSRTPGIDILGTQIRNNYVVVAVCGIGILVVTAGGAFLWWTGGSLLGGAAAAGGGAAAATIGEGALTVSLDATVSGYRVSRLIAMARSADGLTRLAQLPGNLHSAAIALRVLQDGGTLTLAQLAVLRGFGLVP